jgi:ATP synthase subunit 6
MDYINQQHLCWFNNPMEQFQILDLFFNIFSKKPCPHSIFIISNFFFIILCLFYFFYFVWLILLNFQSLLIPTKFQFILEKLYSFVNTIIKENINITFYYKYYGSYLYFIFFFILCSNLISIIPYTFAITSHFLLTFTLSTFSMYLINSIALERFGLQFFGLFLPQGSPLIIAPFLIIIEIISYIARVFSLAIRLSANIMSGHILLKILSGFSLLLGFLGIPLNMLIIAIYSLESLIAILQAYVSLVSLTIYFKESLYLH